MGRLQGFVWLIFFAIGLMIILAFIPYLKFPTTAMVPTPGGNFTEQPLSPEFSYLTYLTWLIPIAFSGMVLYIAYQEWKK
jgi:hypothetical protein